MADAIKRYELIGHRSGLGVSVKDGGSWVVYDDHAAEIARLTEDLAHEKRQRAFVETHLTRADCGAFRIGMPYETSTCDPAKPCVRCAQAKEIGRLRAVVAKEHEDTQQQRAGWVPANYEPCICLDCTAHRSAQEKAT